MPEAAPAARAHVAGDGLKVPVEFVVKLTVPVGVVGLVDVSVTLAVHVLAVFTVTKLGAQLMVVVVEATTGAVTVTLTLVGAVVAPNGEPVTIKVNEPVGVDAVVPMVRILVPVGVAGLVPKLHVTPVGRGVTQDNVTGLVAPAARVAVIVTVTE